MIAFDIETEALPIDELWDVMPPFNPDDVALGNCKDPEKVAAKIEEARRKHEKRFLDDAALSATTGRILVIGVYNGEEVVIGSEDELTTLQEFWKLYVKSRDAGQKLIGVNIHDFDLPFIVRRSWMHGISVPTDVVKDYRWFHPLFVDLRKVWLLGQQTTSVKSDFNTLAVAFGNSRKNGDGSQFAELWRTDRPKAVEYLTNDLKLPYAWAERMGVS